MNYKNIIITGSIAYDEIMNFPGEFKDHFHADKLHQINVSFVVDRLEKQLGGTATNIAYNIQQMLKLKCQNSKIQINNKLQKNSKNKINSEFKTCPEQSRRILNSKLSILGAVGKDGTQFIDFFKSHGIDTNGLLVDEFLYTSTGKVITDKVDNQIWGFYYGASSQTYKINLKKYADKNSLVVISANHPAGFLKFQKQAIEIGCDYLYDSGMTLTWITDADLLEGIKHSCWLVGNDYEIGQIEKRLRINIKQMVEWGVTVITTLGEKGANCEGKTNDPFDKAQGKQFSMINYQSALQRGESTSNNQFINKKNIKNKYYSFQVPAVKVKKVVDPTGAGDAWRGGFIAGIIAGKSIDICVKWANVLASFAVEKVGTVNHKISKKEFEKRLLLT